MVSLGVWVLLGTVSGTGCRHCAVHPSGRLSMEIAICIRYAVVVVRALLMGGSLGHGARVGFVYCGLYRICVAVG